MRSEITTPASWLVTRLTPEHADAMVGWKYEPPFERYSLTGALASAFVDPTNGFVAIVDGTATLIGYRSFGPDGRVPGSNYGDLALDTGGGLRPDLTGRGYGAAAIELGLDYGTLTFRPLAFRITVWSQNKRALKVVRSLGFTPTDQFAATTNGEDYTILMRPQQLGR